MTKMLIDRSTVEQALEALEEFCERQTMLRPIEKRESLKAALAEPTPFEDVVTHGSAWSKDGKRIDPMSVYAEPVQDEIGRNMK